MAHVLIMPRQGNTVESCIIVDWKVKEGDSVAADTAVCDVETDKATFEVPAGESGTVLKLLKEQGDDVPVLEPIAVIGQAGEDWAAVLASAPGAAGEVPPPKPAVDGPSVAGQSVDGLAAAPGPVSPDNRLPLSPRARNLAAQAGRPVVVQDGAARLEAGPGLGPALGGSGPGGRIIERDVAAALRDLPPLSGAAKAALGAYGEGRGFAAPSVGSGLAGRVVAADLLPTESAGTPAAAVASLAGAAAAPEPGEGRIVETPIKGIRKIIADRMYRSLAESAQFTLNSTAPVKRLQELRARMKTIGEPSPLQGLSKVTVNDLILFAVSRVLPHFPFMNAHKIGDTLKTFERVHLGVAVDTPRGLMVPVIRNANLLSLSQISAEAKRLAAACQGGSVKPEELTGSTFTVTNLGSLGVVSFTPVLNAPEVAILGVGGIELKPVAAEDGEIRFEGHIGFSLTINHQVVDGAPAARFLKALGEAVAEIDLWLTQ
ncbi:MAG: 2-oxo acid dehydrogenase subunit E2 [Spirochaetaceae bacterium]|jgi:pyruvate dehydrogenase E2 component (dihydrolipoamide acetyltransferase)|nr:2-oxo acid dehydrogenase subunit E2 [Spirochaetaceae bacterium]